MNTAYHIFTDASADFQPEFAKKEQIHVIPMSCSLGDEELICSCAESNEEIKRYYDGQRDGKMTRTTQISPQKYIDAFLPFVKKGESILYLSLSGGLSSTHSSSLIAAKELSDDYPYAKVVCIDSRSATIGIGLLLECAAKNRADGMSIEENAAWLEENRLKVCHWFMVDDLMHLKRGGRISPTTAIVGSALNIKPILRIEADGTLASFAKKRGAKAAMSELVELYKQNTVGGKGERVLIVHSDNTEGADFLEQEIKKINPDCVITINMLTPIIGCHTGPGMCAIVHFSKPECARKADQKAD